jgi:hypothetical protein
VFVADPAKAAQVGADGTAINAPLAVLAAQRIFDQRAPRFTTDGTSRLT